MLELSLRVPRPIIAVFVGLCTARYCDRWLWGSAHIMAFSSARSRSKRQRHRRHLVGPLPVQRARDLDRLPVAPAVGTLGDHAMRPAQDCDDDLQARAEQAAPLMTCRAFCAATRGRFC